MAHYAWSPISAGEKSAEYGEAVTPGKLGIEKEDFDALVESGAVRETKPPDLPDTWQGSPADFMRAQLAEEAVTETVAAEAPKEEDK